MAADAPRRILHPSPRSTWARPCGGPSASHLSDPGPARRCPWSSLNDSRDRRRRLAARRVSRRASRRPTNLGSSMDVSLFFAGTAGSVPTARRGLPALLLRAGGERDPDRLRRGHAAAAAALGRPARARTPSSSPTSTSTTGSGCWGWSRRSTCAGASRPLSMYGPPGLQRLFGAPAADRRAHRLPARDRRPRAARRGPLRLLPDHAVPGQAPDRGLRVRVRRGRAAGAVRRRGRARRSACRRARLGAASSAARPSTASRRSR